MIGLVIATHGNLGSELLQAVEMIIGPVRNARAVSIQRHSSLESIRDDIQQAIAEVGVDGAGVIIATDMFGGTPANVGMTLLESGRVELLTGVNLPMLLKFFSYRQRLTLPELAEQLQSDAREGILLGSAVLTRQS